MNYEVGERGYDLLKKWEGLRLNAYRDTKGIPTIGYGSTRYFDEPGQPVVRMGDRISEERAEDLLHYTVNEFWEEVESKIYVPLMPWHVDSLNSLVYNIGTRAFSTSTLLRLLNKGDFQGAEYQFPRWNKETKNGVSVPNKGLTNRRAEEVYVFSGRENQDCRDL